ncbi:hypothetical protein HS088_TW09G00417 [Tripterygium wilfordii]|uniref:Uncharacterized protein n=1 Tax=Tripterygium wilfordii TaxID=458696 RepID=A0A7J7D7S0_TRIWF|nr:hypothetical protein HS088_TW09G00417 [Tripterygium wilfordii]
MVFRSFGRRVKEASHVFPKNTDANGCISSQDNRSIYTCQGITQRRMASIDGLKNPEQVMKSDPHDSAGYQLEKHMEIE